MRAGSGGLAPGQIDPTSGRLAHGGAVPGEVTSGGATNGAALANAARASRRWGDLRWRAISALVLAPIALACVWSGGPVFVALVGAALVLLVAEWARLCRDAHAPLMLAGGTLWLLLAAAALLFVRADGAIGRANLLFLLLLIWASDIGAYLIGRLVGGKRLAPLISPGKTWSGAVGGIAAALAVGCGADWLLPGGGLARVALVALVLCVIGQLGDLAESWAKRRFGVKDSGRLIPGHGGLLDRLDALVAVAPFAALLALCLGRGVLLWQ
jgi:phosphatidate cytidylyltransferase